MKKREKITLSIDGSLMNDVMHECVDLKIDRSDAVEFGLEYWLSHHGPDSRIPEELQIPEPLRAQVKELCAQQKISVNAALNHAVALLIDYYRPDSVTVKIPVFLKKSASWMQRRFRSESQADTLDGLLQKLIEFSESQAQGASPQSGYSTKSDKAG